MLLYFYRIEQPICDEKLCSIPRAIYNNYYNSMNCARSILRKISPPAWIFLLTFALRFLVLSRLAASPYFLPAFSDMKFYSDWGLRIAQGQLTTGQSFYGLPGYAYFLALIYALIGFDPFFVGAIQAAAEGGTAVFLFLIARELFLEDPRSKEHALAIGTIASLAWAFFQPAQTFSIILMPTSWLILAFWGCIYWMIKTRETGVGRPWAAMGLLIGAMAMMIATILFLLPMVFWTICNQVRGTGRKCAAISITLLAVFVGMSPCWIHNRFIAHEPVVLSAHSGLNFYIGNNETSNGYPKMPPGMSANQENMLADSITLAEKDLGHPLKHYEVSQYWSEKAHDYIAHHFRAWVKLMAIKFRNFWNAYQYDDLSLIMHFSQDGIILPGLRFGFLSALGIAGMVLAIFKYPRGRWVVAAVLLHMSALMSVFITERYRMAAAPGLCLLAALFVVDLWECLMAKRWAPAAGICAISTAAAFFVSLPQLDRSLWWLDYYNTGIHATEVGELDKAQRNLEIAYSYVPSNADSNFALGNLWLAKNDVVQAKHFYQQTLLFDPHYAKAWNNVGVLALAEHRWSLANKFLTNSLADSPNDAKTHFLLARIKLELGDAPGARSQIQVAIALKPEEKAFRELAAKIETADTKY